MVHLKTHVLVQGDIEHLNISQQVIRAEALLDNFCTLGRFSEAKATIDWMRECLTTGSACLANDKTGVTALLKKYLYLVQMAALLVASGILILGAARDVFEIADNRLYRFRSDFATDARFQRQHAVSTAASLSR